MTPVERLQAAIEKLEQMRADSHNWRARVDGEEGPEVVHEFDDEYHGPGFGTLAWTTSDVAGIDIVTLHRTVDAQLAFLNHAVKFLGSVGHGTSSIAGPFVDDALSLADAILGGNS